MKNLDKYGVMETLQTALSKADTKSRKKRIKATIIYIENNWGGVKARENSDVVGCSAEGHVSHVLSSRMSSRPMVWSKEGAKKMAALCSLKAGGENIQKIYLKDDKMSDVNLAEELQKELKKYGPNNFGKEARNNIHGLIKGSERFRAAIKALKNHSA